MKVKNQFKEREPISVLEQKPPMLSVPLHEDPAGVLRVGTSRVLFELVIQAYQHGASPEAIVQMYDALDLRDVYVVIAYYLAYPTEVDEYLRRCEEEADAIRRKIEASQPPRPNLKEELLGRKRARETNS